MMKNASNGECGLTPAIRAAIAWAQQEAGFCVDLKDLLSHRRYAHLVRIRRLSSWRLRTYNRWSFPRIAAVFKRDHASIMHLVELENESRGLEANYPRNIWLAEQKTALVDNIDIMAKRIDAGARIDVVAYEFRVPTHALKIELKAFRRRTADNLPVHSADNQTTDRIAAEPFRISA